MEAGDLYSLSNSTSDESSNKSDSSIGQHFDPLCGYPQSYDKSNELVLINNLDKYNDEDDVQSMKKLKKSNQQKDSNVQVLSIEDYKMKKSGPLIAMSSVALSLGTAASTTTVAANMRNVAANVAANVAENEIGRELVGPSSVHHHQVANKSKPKGLFNLFSGTLDETYRNAEMMKVHPLASPFYKNKRANQFRDEFMLNLTRNELRPGEKGGKDNEQKLLDGFALNNRLKDSVSGPKSYASQIVDETEKEAIVLEQGRDLEKQMSSFERLRGNSLLGNSLTERTDLRNLHGQSTSRVAHFESLHFERMKQHSPFITKDSMNETQANTALRSTLTRDAFMTHLQQTHPQQQHQQQQQTKSFTIDAILGLRSNQRDKHRGPQFRKHQGQDDPQGKHASNSCSSGSGGGKLKRVRTIFTAEQLERLEGEFARQQYMVGPERLYLAHALHLTEAQVKVWFQNRRIKWRKVNHEQQSQRLHELHQRSLSSLEHEDSNENGEW